MWPDLEKDVVAVSDYRIHGRFEEHGTPDVLPPVLSVVRRAQTSLTGDRRIKRNARYKWLEPLECCDQLRLERIHLRTMICNIDFEESVEDVLGCKLVCEIP